MEYAYLGEVTLAQFGEITEAFPTIVGIGIYKGDDVPEDEKGDLIVLGVPKTLPEQVIGIYQLIVAVWDDEEAMGNAWQGLHLEF